MSDNNRVFISCASREFQHPGAPFAGLRDHLARQLVRADCEVKWQEVFSQPGDDTDTVRKVGDSIRDCAAVIHLIGAEPGDPANPRAVADFLQAEPAFLAKYPDLRAALGDFGDLTYTQWEAFQALHYGVRLFLYVTPAGAAAQREHLDRLRLARRYPGEPFATERDLYGQLLGDLRTIIPTLAPAPRIATSRIVYRHSAEELLGRDAELAWLDQAWADGTHALVIVAWGGVGKTALLINWLQTRFIDRNWQDADGAPLLDAYFDWSFYDQGTGTAGVGRGDGDQPAARAGNLGAFFEQALGFFGDPDPNRPGKGERLARLVQAQRTLFVLDGLEPLQYPPGSVQAGQLLDPDLATFIHALAQRNPGLLVITSREHLRGFVGNGRRDLEDLTRDTAVALLRRLQITGTDAELAAACERFGCHALSLDLVGRFLARFHRNDIRRIDCIRDLRQRTAWRVLETYESWLARAQGADDPRELALLRLTGLFDRPAGADLLAALRASPAIPGLTDALVGLGDIPWHGLLARLHDARLIKLRPEPDERDGIDAHPLIRGYFAEQLRLHQPAAFAAAHARLFDHLCAATPEGLRRGENVSDGANAPSGPQSGIPAQGNALGRANTED